MNWRGGFESVEFAGSRLQESRVHAFEVSGSEPGLNDERLRDL